MTRATMIADNCDKVYEGKYLDLATAYPQLDAVATYMKARIWIYGPQRDYHRRQRPEATGTAVEGFDPTARETGFTPSAGITGCLTAMSCLSPPHYGKHEYLRLYYHSPSYQCY